MRILSRVGRDFHTTTTVGTVRCVPSLEYKSAVLEDHHPISFNGSNVAVLRNF